MSTTESRSLLLVAAHIKDVSTRLSNVEEILHVIVLASVPREKLVDWATTGLEELKACKARLGEISAGLE